MLNYLKYKAYELEDDDLFVIFSWAINFVLLLMTITFILIWGLNAVSITFIFITVILFFINIYIKKSNNLYHIGCCCFNCTISCDIKADIKWVYGYDSLIMFSTVCEKHEDKNQYEKDIISKLKKIRKELKRNKTTNTQCNCVGERIS